MKIHKTAEVQTSNIGYGTEIWQFCLILSGAIIGAFCNINFNVFIENDVTIGDYVTIKPGVQIWDGVTLEDFVFIGPNVAFTNDLVPRSKMHRPHYQRTLLKKGCSIGANSTIVAGITIGEYAFIGAGSVVTKAVPPYSVWYGNPARHKGYITADGILLNKYFVSKEGAEYVFKNNLLVQANLSLKQTI
jgi:UDP-2-acetamido-3-amino-2,3-dideoxy-glucuronate N-acetyltransferase